MSSCDLFRWLKFNRIWDGGNSRVVWTCDCFDGSFVSFVHFRKEIKTSQSVTRSWSSHVHSSLLHSCWPNFYSCSDVGIAIRSAARCMNPFSGVTDWCFSSVWALGDASRTLYVWLEPVEITKNLGHCVGCGCTPWCDCAGNNTVILLGNTGSNILLSIKLRKNTSIYNRKLLSDSSQSRLARLITSVVNKEKENNNNS